MVHDSGVLPDPVAAQVFFGRERERAELQGGLRSAVAGHGSLYLVVGEPGIGKTRLGEALARAAPHLGVTALWGRCWENGGAPAYWPWIQVMRPLVRGRGNAAVVGNLSRHGVALAQPELHEIVSGLAAFPPSTAETEDARFRLFEAVTAFLRDAAAQEPLLIVLDDLHAADEPSLRLLQFVARELSDAALLVVGIYRELEVQRQPEHDRLLSRIGRGGHRIHLRGLSEQDVASFVAALSPSASPELARMVYRTTEGNPFFIDEVVRLLVADQEHPQSPSASIRIPPGVRAAIRDRLRPLSAGCREVLSVAAVIGREFDVSCLQQVTDVPAEALLDVLREAEVGGIVEPAAHGFGRYSFHHALIRETLYDDCAPAERMRRHGRIGEALERRHATDPEPHLAELAHQFLQAAPAGGIDKAVHYAMRAGERAVAVLAYEEAASRYERALHALALQPDIDPMQQLELLLALGDVHARMAAPNARDTCQRAADLARRLQAPTQLARAALSFANLGLGVPQNLPDIHVVQLLQQAVNGFDEADSILRARLLARLAMELSVGEERERSAALREQALDMARRLGDAPTLASVLSMRHFTLWRSDFLRDRLAISTEIVQLGHAIGDPELALQGRGWRLLDLMGIGAAHQIDQEIEAYASQAHELRQPRHLWFNVNLRAMRALWRGEWEHAERLAHEALALAPRAGNPMVTMVNPWVQTFVAHRELGRLAEHEAMGRVFAEHYPASPAPRTFLAMIYAEGGAAAAARAEFEHVAVENFADLARKRRIGVLPYLAEVCAFLDDARRAAALYEQLLPLVDLTIPYGVSVCFGAAAHSLALLARTMRRPQQAVHHFEDALTQHERMQGFAWLARTRYEYARFLLGRGEPDDVARAAELLRQADEGAHRLQMTALRSRLDELQPQVDMAAAAQQAQPEGGRRAYGNGATEAGEPDDEPWRGARGSGRVLAFRLHRARRPDPPFSRTVEAEARPATPTAHDGIFRREGEYWSVGIGSDIVRLKDAKGLRYIAQLLRYPGREFHATDLVALNAADPDVTPSPLGRDQLARLGLHEEGWREEIVDANARAAYKRRLEDLRDALDEATRFNDVARAAAARAEIEFLSSELARAIGLGGRGRTVSTAAERARLNVTRAIRAVVKRLGSRHPHLSRYLQTTIKTGGFCSYTPDPRIPMRWSL